MSVRTVWLSVLIVVHGAVHAGAGAPQDPAARAHQLYERALRVDADGNHLASLPLLWEAAGLAPHDADIQNGLGEALERLGALDAAIDAYRRALVERPTFRKASNNLILVMVKAGKGSEAVQRARALAAAAPADADRLFTLGLAQADVDIDGAMASFRQVLALAPRHVLARYNLALVLRRADRLPEAIDQLRRALEVEERPEMHYSLGVIYWHQGDLDRAEGALRAAIAVRGDHADAHVALGSVLGARGDSSGAVRSLRQAAALRPGVSTVHYTLARVLQQHGDVRAAQAAFQQAEHLRVRGAREQEATVLTAVGAGRLASGDATGALTIFQRATTVLDDYAPAHYQMGLALARLGRRDAARDAFARASQLNPGLVSPDIAK
jgi:tetratricopeptide (TPR) repeat protein